jgi:hypothetical protein
VVSLTACPLYPQGKISWYPLERRLGGPTRNICIREVIYVRKYSDIKEVVTKHYLLKINNSSSKNEDSIKMNSVTWS